MAREYRSLVQRRLDNSIVLAWEEEKYIDEING